MIITILYTYIIVLYNLIYKFHVKQNMEIWQDYLPPTFMRMLNMEIIWNHQQTRNDGKKRRSILQKLKRSWKNLDRLPKWGKNNIAHNIPTDQQKETLNQMHLQRNPDFWISLRCLSHPLMRRLSLMDIALAFAAMKGIDCSLARAEWSECAEDGACSEVAWVTSLHSEESPPCLISGTKRVTH